MARSIRLAFCLVVVLSAGGALAQTPDAQTAKNLPETVSTPVTHVYVGSGNQIAAYSAAADGQLTPVPGSPFNSSLSLMGANGHFLFGFEPNSVIIQSFSMAANGALKLAATTDTEDFASNDCSPLTTLYGQGLRIDHSGLSLYNAAIPNSQSCYSALFQSFRIDDANGALSYLGGTAGILLGNANLGILGNNKYAYSLSCVSSYTESPSPNIGAFQRSSNGLLVTSSATAAIPTPPMNVSDPQGPSAGFYCPYEIATDPTNHLAMTFYALENGGNRGLNQGYGPMVIASYTADASGNLTTTSTYENMPQLPWWPNTLRMAPSGKLLAAGGPAGVVIFHFNGGNPVTKYTTLLPTDAVSTILWDNSNHMYALGTDTTGDGKLWVYTVTPTSVSEAPGSPYAINNAGSMVVQPLL